MKEAIRKIAILILAVLFVVSTALSLRQRKDHAGGDAAYAAALDIAAQTQKTEAPEALASLPTESVIPETEQVTVWMPVPVEDDPMMDEMADINLAGLREVNPDVAGWIRIPDTAIDYPLVQGKDNEFYLHHTWEKDPNSVGSIFLESENNPDMTDYNTIIYGHNMANGTMFGQLQHFALADHWKSHPYVYIVTDAGVFRYEIFAFFHAEVESLTYGLNPRREDTKEKFLNLSLENAWYDTGIKPAVTDRILTLSTCSGANYSYRYVVQARLPMIAITQ